MTHVALERPAYKHHPLWTEAIALAHQTYAVAQALADRDPEGARRLRRLAVSVPALLAEALSAEHEPERAADVSEARAALRDLASSAERLSGLPAASADLPRRAQALDRSVGLELGVAEDGLPS
jgi:four helix bundle protein